MLIAVYSNSKDCRKSQYSKADSVFLNVDSTATSKTIRSLRHCMQNCEVVYKDILKRLTA